MAVRYVEYVRADHQELVNFRDSDNPDEQATDRVGILAREFRELEKRVFGHLQLANYLRI